MSVVQIGRAEMGGLPVAVVRIDGAIYRLQDVLPNAPGADRGDLDALLAEWARFGDALATVIPPPSAAVEPSSIGRFLAPLIRPPHLICIGTNYRDHIAEMRIPANPQFPYAFLKPLTTIAPPAGPVVLPSMSAMVDWEAELGVVIGIRARNITAADAIGVVAAYLPLNDVSARDWIDDRPSLGIDWVMQKGHDDFTPFGPWLTLASCVSDPQNIPVECSVNGIVMQRSSTADMLFSVADIIVHLSSIMTLSPGDVIATGTPAGVGFGRSPRLFLKDGDVVNVSLGQLGDFDTHFMTAAA